MLKKLLDFYSRVDKVIFYASASSVIFAILTVIFFSITFTSLPKQLPLFYSRPWGQLQLGSLSQFMIIPSLIILITLINLTISWHLHPSQLLLKRTINLSSTLVALLLFITAARIIFLFI